MTPFNVDEVRHVAAGEVSGRLCGAAFGTSTLFINDISCPACMVALDAALETNRAQIIRAGISYVHWTMVRKPL